MSLLPGTPLAGRRGRSRALLKGAAAVIAVVASLTFLYQLRLAAIQQLEDSAGEGFGGGGPPDDERRLGIYRRWGGSNRDLALPNWRGRAGGGALRPPPAQTQRLAVLLPCASNCPAASILVVYLSHLLRQQGIPFRMHVLEQAGAAPFNPGQLADVGFRAAQRTEPGFQPDYVAVQQAGLVPLPNVSYAYPSSPFLHLAAEQSLFNGALPYPAYCGGAWLAHAAFFVRMGGLSARYVGYEGLEDDTCRRVLAQLGGGEGIPRAGNGQGRFTVSEDAALGELAAANRERNRQTFSSRWGDNATAAAAATEAQLDGLASIPQNWPQLLSPVQQGEEHTWWQVQLPAANSTRR